MYELLDSFQVIGCKSIEEICLDFEGEIDLLQIELLILTFLSKNRVLVQFLQVSGDAFAKAHFILLNAVDQDAHLF